MLCQLSIRDVVIVKVLELDFSAGFSVLTGETGAGKSILIDALAFVLGERADTGLIRAGAPRAEVCAQFMIDRNTGVLPWLESQEILLEDDMLLLRRVLDTSGRSKAYINGSLVTLQQLRALAEFLIDIHGQHAHQSLLRGDAQRALLDAHAGLQLLLQTVAGAWRNLREAEARYETAQNGMEALNKERDVLEWQIRELEALSLSQDEWGALNLEHKRLAHAASLIEGSRFSLALLSEGENACEAQMDAVARRLEDLVGVDPVLEEGYALIVSARTELIEAVSALRRYADRVDLDPARLNELERRMEAILSAARKFRVSPEALPELLESSRERLLALGAATDLEALQKIVDEAQKGYVLEAEKLTKARGQAAKALAKAVSHEMQSLALANGRFEVALLPLEKGGAKGLEEVEFRIGGLAGQASRSLAKVASGGELSRISLAIQVVTSKAAQVPTLIFDEVDVGIGGGVAEVVGRLLRTLAEERQVLCVTHLPQVAAQAHWQWQVSKHHENGEVRSEVERLDAAARVNEIARMLGGVEMTETSRKHAEEMLGKH